jgi:GNAT superfamily N-acetyltransferase
MEIEYYDEPPTIQDYWPLYGTTGWNDEYTLLPEDVAAAIGRAWRVVAAHNCRRLVGSGRTVSDAAMHAMICDLIVHPEYQWRGIGGRILAMLMQKCQDAGICDIQLLSARGRQGFYEKRGFSSHPDDAPGMQYAGLHGHNENLTNV